MEFKFDFTQINSDVKRVLATPSKFFSKNTSQNWKETLSFFLVLSLVGLILTMIYLMYFYPIIIKYYPGAAPKEPFDTSFVTLAPYALYSFILGIFFSFFWGGALFAWTKIFKLQGDFNKAYKTVTYARTLVYLVGWVPVINLAVWLHSMYLLYKGLQASYEINGSKAASLILSGLVAIFVLSSLIFYVSQAV